MQPIRQTRTAQFRTFKMYREDLDELVELFAKACRTMQISDGKNRYDSLDEMKSYADNGRIKELEVCGSDPTVRFLLNVIEMVPIQGYGLQPMRKGSELRTEETTDAADVLFFRVRDFLTAHQRSEYNKGLLAIPTVLALLFLFLNWRYFAWFDDHARLFSFAMITMVLLFLICASFFWSLNRNFLSLDLKRNSPSFFRRNREEFAKHAVTSAIGALAGGIVGYCIGHFLK